MSKKGERGERPKTGSCSGMTEAACTGSGLGCEWIPGTCQVAGSSDKKFRRMDSCSGKTEKECTSAGYGCAWVPGKCQVSGQPKGKK